MDTTTPGLVSEHDLDDRHRGFWLKALSAMEMRNLDYAISLLSTLVKDVPQFLEGRKALRKAEVIKVGPKKKFSLGGASKGKFSSAMKKDPLTAITEIEKALETDPHSVPVNEALYDACMMAAMPEHAAFALETIMNGHPENTKNLHKLAEHFMAQDLPEEAVKAYEKITRIDPTDMDAVKGSKDASARASMAKQNWEGGMRENLANEDEAKELEDKARAAMTSEQIDARLEALFAEYDERKEELEYSKTIANLYERKEDLPEAIKWYEYAHKLSNSDPALESRIGMLKEKHSEGELQALQDDIDNDPDAPDAEEKRQRLAQIRSERTDNLVVEARQRVDRNPTDKQLRFDLGLHLFNSGNYTDAIPELQQARTNPHIRTRAMLLLGKCFANKDMFDMAARQMDEAVSELTVMDDTKKDLLYELGLVYEKMGDQEKSLGSFKEIYEVDYGYRDVAQRVEASYGDS